jgi:hypothetical protein
MLKFERLDAPARARVEAQRDAGGKRVDEKPKRGVDDAEAAEPFTLARHARGEAVLEIGGGAAAIGRREDEKQQPV